MAALAYIPCQRIQRVGLPWTNTIAPLRYAAEFSVPMGFYTYAGSPAFYLFILALAGVSNHEWVLRVPRATLLVTYSCSRVGRDVCWDLCVGGSRVRQR